MLHHKPAALLFLTLFSPLSLAQSYPGYDYNNAYPNYYGNSTYNAPAYSGYGNSYAPSPQGSYSGNSAYANGYPVYPSNAYNQGYAYPNQAYQQPYAGNYYYRPYYPKKKQGMFDRGPFKKGPGGRDFMEELWPGEDGMYEDVLPIHGPWDRDWGKAPWNREYENMYDPDGGPEKWMDFSDPKEGLAWMWEDAIITPNRLGVMPGGWEAPSVVVPNPVDVGDEFKNASGDFPGEVKDFADGFTFGDRTVTGSKPKADGGSFGMGNKKDGINITPKNKR